MKGNVLLYLLLLIYSISIIFSCKNNPKPKDNLTHSTTSQDSLKFTLEDTLIAHASLIKSNAEGIIYSQLLKEIRDKGVAKAITYCSPENNSTFKDMCIKRNISMKRHSINSISERNEIDKIKSYFKEKKGPPYTHVVNHDLSSKVYLGFSLRNPTCLKCHGIKYQDVYGSTVDALEKNFPSFTESNLKINELMGLWEITFYKKK